MTWTPGMAARRLIIWGMTLGGVGEVIGFVLEVELEAGLGDVQTGIDGRFFVIHNCGCVLTHSCGYELAWLRRRSGNGSSSGRKSADGSGWASDSKGPRVERSHPRRCAPPAGGAQPHLPVWLTPNKEDEKQHTRVARHELPWVNRENNFQPQRKSLQKSFCF